MASVSGEEMRKFERFVAPQIIMAGAVRRTRALLLVRRAVYITMYTASCRFAVLSAPAGSGDPLATDNYDDAAVIFRISRGLSTGFSCFGD